MATRTNDRASCNDSCCARSSGVVALWLLAVLVMYASSKLSLMLQLSLILKAIIARQAAQQFVALPVVEDPSQILACGACHGRQFVLPDLLTDDDPTGRDLLPEMIHQLQHRPRDSALKRKEASVCYHGVGVAQPTSEKLHERFVDLVMFFRKSLELGSAYRTKCGIAHRRHRRRTRQPINGGKLTDNGARAEKLEDALGAGTRNHRNLEEAVLHTIAAVSGSARPEQDLTRGEPYPVRVSKQFRRKIGRQF